MRFEQMLRKRDKALKNGYLYNTITSATAGVSGSDLKAVYVENNGKDTLYYTHTDYQGNLIKVTDEKGKVMEQYAYDPWGLRRNPTVWHEPDTRKSFLFDRGYTLHEHLDDFGLVNMNGRVYDPLLAQFLSPDPYIQSPENWLNYNRYAYGLNNPLMFTDPDGEFIFSVLAAIFCPPLLPIAIAADVSSIVNVASNWNNIDNFGEGLAYYGVGAVSGAVSQVPGVGVPLSGFINGAGNEFLNTNILTKDVSWKDLSGRDAGKILLSGGIGAASSYYGAKWGAQLSDKAINGLNVEAIFLKNSIERTFQGFTSGYLNGFFNEVMLGSGDVETAFKSGFVQGGWGAAFGFTFSSVEYGVNRNGVEQYWTRKELKLNIKRPYNDYYEYNFKYENGIQPNSPYYQYNPRITPYNLPGNNWQAPIKPPIPQNNSNLLRTMYPKLYYPWRR